MMVSLTALLTFTLFGMASGGKIFACYYAPSKRVPISKIPADICTHLIFAFGEVEPDGIQPSNPSDKNRYQELTSLKQVNPDLKVLLSLQKGFSQMVGGGPQTMKTFSVNAIKFLRQYKFDGVDFDWEFPKKTEKDSYMKFLSIFRQTVMDESASSQLSPLLVSMALAGDGFHARNCYDAKSINQYIDFATIMTYDYHMYIPNVDNTTGYNSPLYPVPGERKDWCASGSVETYRNLGLDSSKILLGVPSYGRSYTLADPGKHGLHAPAAGRGPPGPVAKQRGLVVQEGICQQLQGGATRVFDKTAGAPYYYLDTTWVSYDDKESVTLKCKWVLDNDLAGVGVWALNIDDISGTCPGGPLPLLQTIKSILV